MKTAYLLTALGVIFLAIICSFIVPEGKLKKSINFVLRIICIGVLIQPISSLFNFNPQNYKVNYDYEYICKVYSDNQSNLLTQKVNSELNTDVECRVEIIYKDDKIIENGVVVLGDFVEEDTKGVITEYLQELGYINITVNEKSD